MVRADLLIKLVRSLDPSSQKSISIARAIAEEERRNNHPKLATSIEKAIAGTKHTTFGTKELAQAQSDRPILVTSAESATYFSDLVLSEEQAQTLTRVLVEFRNRTMLSTHSLRYKSKLLFCGPPGCGKTVTAHAIAGELGIPVAHLEVDRVVSSLLGESSRNIEAAFSMLRVGSWVILVDEFDSISFTRSTQNDHGEMRRVVNTVLRALDRFSSDSILVAATNMPASLDKAAWRRFDEVVAFGPPSKAEAELLIEKFLGKDLSSPAVVEAIHSELKGEPHAAIERTCQEILKTLLLTCPRPTLDRAVIDTLKGIRQQLAVAKHIDL